MAVLDKIVSTSDEEQQRQEREERISSVPLLESHFPSENVLLASQFSSEATQIAENTEYDGVTQTLRMIALKPREKVMSVHLVLT
jgi:hypothetical protein